MPSLTPSWPDALDPIIRKFYFDGEKQVPGVLARFFDTATSTKSKEQDSSSSGLTRMSKVAETEEYPEDNEIQGYDVTYTHVEWGQSTSVSQKMYEDDQHNVMKRKALNLGRSKARTLEQWRADIFNNAFTVGGGGTAPFTAGDAVALCSASHPRSDGGTAQSNTSTIDLSEAGIEEGTLAMRNTLDNRGQLVAVKPNVLLIPPALEKEARILLESTQRVGTSNNDINPYTGKLEIVVADYLSAAAGGSDTAWFLIDTTNTALMFFNRVDRGVIGPEWNNKSRTAKWFMGLRASIGFSSWVGVWGSTGTGA